MQAKYLVTLYYAYAKLVLYLTISVISYYKYDN